MLPLTLRWAMRDMRGSLRHFRFILLCLFLSIMAVTTVHVGGSAVLNSIDRQGNVILGGDWVLRQLYTPIGDEERQWVAARGAEITETIEFRGMVINPETQDAALAEIKAVRDGYPLYGRVQTDPPAADFSAAVADGVFLDRVLAERLNLKIGDQAQLGEMRLTVRGWIVTEPDRGGGQFGLAPRAFLSQKNLDATGLNQPGSMIAHLLRVRWPIGADQRALKKEFLEDMPDRQWKLRDRENASPQIRRAVDNLVQFLSLIGLSSLLIGGIGIANGMRAYFQSRLATIAIFKSVGMGDAAIRAVYGWQIALIALAGTVLGIAAGCVIPHVLLPFAKPYLPFDVQVVIGLVDIAIPLSFGILTSAIFSLIPLGEAQRTSPLILLRSVPGGERQKPLEAYLLATLLLAAGLTAIVVLTSAQQMFSLYFIGGAAVSFAVFYSIGHLVSAGANKVSISMPFVFRLALRQIGGRGNLTAQTMVSLGIGLTVLIAVALTERNLSASLSDNLPKDAPAFFFLDIQPDQKSRFEEVVKSFPAASNLIVMPNLRGKIVSVNGVPAADALVDKRQSWLLSNDRGFTYTDRLPAHSEITAGNWWPVDYKGPPIISVVDDVALGFGVKPGDKLRVSVLGREIEAEIANVRDVNWMNLTVNFAITFAPGTLEAAPHSWLATVVADPQLEIPIQKAITREFPNVTLIRLSEAIQTITSLFSKMNVAVRVMAGFALFNGIIVLVEALAATRHRRSYEAVVHKVLGVTNRQLRNAMLIEFALLGLLAACIATGLGAVASWLIIDGWMHFEWRFFGSVAVLVAVGALAATIGTSWAILGRIMNAPASQFLRND